MNQKLISVKQRALTLPLMALTHLIEIFVMIEKHLKLFI